MWFARVNVAFDDEVGVGGDFEVVGLALHQFDGFLAEITGQQEFIQSIRQRCGGGEGEDGIAPEKNRDGHARAGLIITPPMTRADFLQLPMHAGRAFIVDLHAVNADIAFARVGIFRHDARQGDETSAIEGPAFLNGKIEERWRCDCGVRSAVCGLNVGRLGPRFDLVASDFELRDDLLARSVLHNFRFRVTQIECCGK